MPQLSRRTRFIAALSSTALLVTGLVATTGTASARSHGGAGSYGHSDSQRHGTLGTTWSTGATDQVRAALAEGELPAPERPKRARPFERVATAATTSVSDSTSATTRLATTSRTVAAPSAVKTGKALNSTATAKTLIVYDNTGDWAWLGEAYATQVANLVSRFGSWTAHPVGGYAAGEVDSYDAVIYVGSTYDEPLPAAFLADVTTTSKKVVWLYDNIWQLTAHDQKFAESRGFMWKEFDFSSVTEVSYKGTTLTRDKLNNSGIMDTVIYDAGKVTPVATAVRADGTTFPWGVTSGNFTYLGEMPFSYISHDDRYLAFADRLFDVLAPGTADRHRALVRIEDVGPDSEPSELRAVADYLSSKKVPFTVAVYPRYRNPKGVDNNGRAEDYTLRQRPQVVSALRYMQAKGGTLLMHGYTHQFGNIANPYDGMSANDFEFFSAHVDANDSVIYDGPVPGDSAWYATSRVTASAQEFARAGLTPAKIFEFPHYAGSAVDYQVVNSLVGTRYDRGLYFAGALTGGKVDHKKMTGQFFPYAVRDVYGSAVIPENIGNVEPEAFNNHPARLAPDLVASARANLAVRDGMASFFYHPYLGTDHLKQVVEGVQGLGYTFVPGTATLNG